MGCEVLWMGQSDLEPSENTALEAPSGTLSLGSCSDGHQSVWRGFS